MFCPLPSHLRVWQNVSPNAQEIGGVTQVFYRRCTLGQMYDVKRCVGKLDHETDACIPGHISDMSSEQCELARPSTWPIRDWIRVVTTYGTRLEHTIYDSVIHDDLQIHDPKVKIRNNQNISSILLSHLWTSTSPPCSGVVSHLLLEKLDWSRLAPGGKRQLRYFYCNGKHSKVVMNGTKGSYTSSQGELAYEFLATSTKSHPGIIHNDASKNADLKSIMDKGYKIFRSNFARDKDSVIVLQHTMKHLSLDASGNIKIPPKWHCEKHVLGQDTWVIFQEISRGVPDGLRTFVAENRNYDPRWLPVEFNSAEEAFLKVRGYILQGQRMRVKAGLDYHDAIDVIRIDFNVWFILSP
ncbi:hypothetical protein RRG08_014914 [Elysia crispata]|uniref:Uncharacterized protein n=1 Tax=Elysia crispata TaxID=231223 RepID=A0AAE0ZXV0_9GAST|nr:hypothetical protein RRG08_014914 [Elysia crispata]